MCGPVRIALCFAALGAVIPAPAKAQSPVYLVARAEMGVALRGSGLALEIGGPREHAALELSSISGGVLASTSYLYFVAPEQSNHPYFGLGLGLVMGDGLVLPVLPVRMGAEFQLIPKVVALRAEAREYLVPLFGLGHAGSLSLGVRLF